MEARFTIRKKFIVNGKEYGSLAELPQAVREAYEKAAAATAGPLPEKITVNGQQYDSVDALPSDLRALYDAAMGEARPQAAPPLAGVPGPVKGRLDADPRLASDPGEASLLPRWVIVLIALAAAAAVYYFGLR